MGVIKAKKIPRFCIHSYEKEKTEVKKKKKQNVQIDPFYVSKKCSTFINLSVIEEQKCLLHYRKGLDRLFLYWVIDVCPGIFSSP